ncbi:hypothetical protein C6361_35430 [Plantactinospora sp. BC1]|nr:hypothetical protein C6361_35430 [Plantactinospora sp. BC1]
MVRETTGRPTGISAAQARPSEGTRPPRRDPGPRAVRVTTARGRRFEGIGVDPRTMAPGYDTPARPVIGRLRWTA